MAIERGHVIHMQVLFERFRIFASKALNVVLVAVVLLFFNSWATKAVAHDEAVAEQIAAAERAANRGPYATDGTFTGSAQGYGGQVAMQVVVKDGYIESVEILDASHEDQAWLDMAVVLPDRIVQAQTTAIDVVSGATYTSVGILNGATEALQKSMAGEVE
ncbi:MAG: FMN-binding protein [Coriobacteriaceae bacterium]|nr:FMN-binding protein [Coriobacteriaceae bacterium]